MSGFVKKYGKVSVYICAGACFCFLLGYNLTQRSQIQKRLVNELRTYTLPLSIDQNTSLQTIILYRYWIAATHDPIFALPDADLSEVENALGEIDIQRSHVLDHFSGKDRDILENSFYKTDFLRALKDSEEARRLFINSPTTKNARSYHYAIKDAYDKYMTQAYAVIAALDQSKNKKFAYPGGRTTAQFLELQITRSIQGAHVRYQQESDRFACLSDYTRCEPLSITQKVIPSQNAYTPGPTDLNKKIVKILQQYIQYRGTSKIEQPRMVVSLPHSTCSPRNKNATYVFGTILTLPSNLPSAEILDASDVLFNDLYRDHDSGSYYDFLIQQGISYSMQPLNPYSCPDFFQDITNVYSAYKIQQSLVAEPLFSSIHTKTDIPGIQELSEQEQAIRDQTTITSSFLIESYIRSLSDLIATQSNRALADLFTQNQIDRMRQLVLSYRSKSASMEQIMGTLAASAYTYDAILTKQKTDPGTLTATRSYFSYFLQFDNQTVTEPPNSLIQFKQIIPLQKMRLVSYLQDLQKNIPISKLLDYIIKVRTTETVAGDKLRKKS